jgi:hypothetical protein
MFDLIDFAVRWKTLENEHKLSWEENEDVKGSKHGKIRTVVNHG